MWSAEKGWYVDVESFEATLYETATGKSYKLGQVDETIVERDKFLYEELTQVLEELNN
jgi:hypothetical protein